MRSSDDDGSRRHIACLLSDRPGEDPALLEGLRLRSSGHARLSLVHVCPPPVTCVSPYGDVWMDDPVALEDAARARLEETARGLDGVEHVLLRGPVVPALCAWARSARVDLIVVTRPASRLRRALVGDPSRCARGAPCPVLVAGERRRVRRVRAARPVRATA